MPMTFDAKSPPKGLKSDRAMSARAAQLSQREPEHEAFGEGSGDEGRVRLRRILLAHCLRNPRLGYTQVEKHAGRETRR